MADGGIVTSIVNAWLDGLSPLWVQLHTGDPGAAGTLNASQETTRKQAVMTTAASGAVSLSADDSWTPWTVGAENIRWVSLWSAATSGTHKGNGKLTTARSLDDGDTFTLSRLDIAITGIV